MATVRKAQVPVGSGRWILDENDQTQQFGLQEAEDFAFAARNEVEWLNEHMADIFTKSQVDVTEIFKTPGKLRGKTPRTARKRTPLGTRQPLTDIFSTNARIGPSPSRSPNKLSQVTANAAPAVVFSPVKSKPQKTNIDSGYHGMSEDEMDTDEIHDKAAPPVHISDGILANAYLAPSLHEVTDHSRPPIERATTTEGSFHSAQEEPVATEEPNPTSRESPEVSERHSSPTSPQEPPPKAFALKETQKTEEDAMQLDEAADGSMLAGPTDESRSPSQGSSPVKPLVRKSSLTFAALPAREPLTTKKSLGARVSRTSHVDQARSALNRGSFLERFTGGKSLGAARHTEEHTRVEDEEVDMDDGTRPQLAREESDGDAKMAKLHNKSSTQRLHDKINMLGKSQPARPTKSIPAAAVVTNPAYPELPQIELQAKKPTLQSPKRAEPVARSVQEDDDDDWIKPPRTQFQQAKRPQLPKSTTADVMENIRGKQHIGDEEFEPGYYDEDAFREPSPIRMGTTYGGTASENGIARSASATALTSPSREEATTKSNVDDGHVVSIHQDRNHDAVSTTPISTPRSKQAVDGPISASKSKLQSIMKTARGLFTSSAGVSAQAKIEAHSSPSARTRSKLQEEKLDLNTTSLPQASGRGTPAKQNLRPESPRQQPEGRKTRSSTEKEERQREEAKLNATSNETPEPDPVHSKATQPSKSTRQSPRRPQNQAEPRQIVEESQPMGPPQVQSSQPQRSKDPRRPMKPAKEALPKPKPQTIQYKALSTQRIPLSNAALSSSLQESLPAAPSRPGLVKKASNASIQTSTSNNSLKSSAVSTTTKPKALLAAERKKEQDERETQRKFEQKREIERKRAAQQEEQRQQERLQREEADRQRERERSAAIEDPKKAASRQLIERRRLELAKKDQQRVPSRQPLNEAAAAHERPAPPTYRPELGGARAPSRLQQVQDHTRPAADHPAPNPARPAIKRVIESDNDDGAQKPARMQAGPSYQQNEAKRRRTGDEEVQEVVRPTMAPPIRQSNIRKDLHKPSLFSNNYSTAPPPATHHQPANSLLKTNTTTNVYQQHSSHQQPPRPGQHPHDMAKYTSNRPPFADAPNPPPPTQTHKTPLPKHLAPAAKSSPQFPNGENIHLDDIPTDESDSDASPDPRKGRPTVAEWVQSPNLRELIQRQEETMNPDVIFGPQQSPHMEEMFKDRHQRFRNRTSSAVWVQDRLTSEEIQRDVEARERMRREGGWTFGM